MTVRTLIPVLALGALGCAAASLGLGYGLGQYTISGMDPFHATVRGGDWRPDRIAVARPQSDPGWQFPDAFDPVPPRH